MRCHKTKSTFLGILVLAGLLGVRAGFPQQTCTENTGSFIEHFTGVGHIDLGQSSAKFWCLNQTSPQDIMTLNKLSGTFQISNPAAMPSWINSVAAGDFDLDGWTDFIGSSVEDCNCLVFVRNKGGQGSIGSFQIAKWIDGSSGDSYGNPYRGVGGAALDGGGLATTAGDYDKDGDIDFLHVTSADATDPYLTRIWLYKNTLITSGQNTGVLNFSKTDLTSAWRNSLVGIVWSACPMDSLDFDGDGDIDIIFGNTQGKVLKITNTNNRDINSQTFIVETTALISTGWGSSGVNTVSVADFDKDGDPDILVGSVSQSSLRYYQNDGTGNFSLFMSFADGSGNLSNNLFDGAATITLASDLDMDGNVDFVVATDDWHYPVSWPTVSSSGYGSNVFLYRNNGANTFTPTLLFRGRSRNPQVADLDCGLLLDYDKDGLMDFLIADGNNSANYYLFHNLPATDVYTLSGTAVSLSLTSTLSSSQYAITRVRMKTLTQSVIGGSSTGLSVTYYVSNNDGQTWELYQQYAGTNIRNSADQAWHDFLTFGTRLRWKAVFSAPADSMPQYTNASYETPAVDQIELEYVYVEKREYSRTSDAATTLTVGGQTRKALIAATFIFPGLDGQLRAYDVTDMRARNVSYSSLQTVTTSSPGSSTGRQLTTGVQILWDAGQLLRDRDPGSRTVYTVYKPSIYSSLTRIAFTRSNASALASLLGDVDGDNAGLIDFVRGVGQTWKLADIQHSNPLIVGPPDGNAALMGSGYSAFAQTWANRTKVVFVGANDGMIHCFDATTGTEIWGFIPYNLVPKLKNLSQKDPLTGAHYRVGETFVDGTPAVADVYINSAWKTVLICGQGPGAGSSVGGGLNYYFALDVTDPQNPQFLWEFTATSVGETWSVPAIGRVMQGTSPRWVAFMGSGYDNNSSYTAGNVFYTVRIDTGATISTKTVSNVNTSGYGYVRPYADIYAAIPGSPTAADSNADGYTDGVYVGDLDGRLWKLTTTNSSTSSWTFTAIYTDRLNYPIVTKPAVWFDPVNPGGAPYVFFGTGGDDRAPSDRNYAFLCLKDDNSPDIEWYLGNATDLGLPAANAKGALETGEKIWTDPVCSDNTVYFSGLKGSIENVNPCLNLSDIGRFYARYIQTEAGGVIGASALKGIGNSTVENLQLTSKARKAVTLGERRQVGDSTKRDVYIQEYDSTVERLEQPGGRFVLIIKSWREVYKIIR